MKDTPAPRAPSGENSPDPVPSSDLGISASPATSMTAEKWAVNQPHYPIQRVPRMVVAHIFKGSIFGPRSWIIEPARRSPRINWVRAFQEAKAAREAAAAAADSEGS